jgi:ATP-binding cassette subfamily B protein
MAHRIQYGSVVPATTGQLVKYMIRPYRGKSFVFFLITFIGNVAYTAAPLMISLIVSHLSKSPRLDTTIWILVAAFVVFRLADEVLWRLGDLWTRSFKPQMVERVRATLFAATLNKPHSFYTNSSSGRIGHWVNQATNTMNELIDTTIWNVWPRLTSLVVSAAFLLTVHWSLALLFVVWLVALFYYTSRRGKQFGVLIAKQSDEASKAAGLVVDSLSNHLSVRVFNAREREQKALLRQQSNIVSMWRTSWMWNIVTNVVKGQSAMFVNAIALVLALVLFANGSIELGGVVLFVAYYGDASGSLWQLAWALDAYYRQFGTVQNALDGLSAEDERTGEIVPASQLPKTAAVSLQGISFAYSDQAEKNVLKNLTLEIPNGQKVGVVGHSGAGKSTLVNLLLGLYEPTTGRILLNDVDIASKDPSFIRSVSSYVPQDTNLFNRTLRENIGYASPKVTDAEIKAALKKAEALEFVEALPKGLDTLVGERGVKLSGGQRQRISIARAILKDAPLLLLDEATSALDSVSEQAIQRSLHKLMENRTALVIAHRLSTLKHLDKIIVIEKGKIAEQGSHDELIAQEGIYADLWKRQKDGFIAE